MPDSWIQDGKIGMHEARLRVVSTVSTKADDIALVIEEAIVSGELSPGTVLRQEQLSDQFEVSRTPIRLAASSAGGRPAARAARAAASAACCW